MNEEQKEILRNTILSVLHAAEPLGMRAPYILNHIKHMGFAAVDEAELAKHLRYLEAHAMIERADRAMSKASELYLCTRAGVAWLDEQGLL